MLPRPPTERGSGRTHGPHAASVAALLVLCWAPLGCTDAGKATVAGPFLVDPIRDVRTYFAPTPDGWYLAAHRYWPPPKYRTPVILCADIGLNSNFWDLDPRVSLGAYLRRYGHDVWLVDLRGAGLSTRQPIPGLNVSPATQLPAPATSPTADGHGSIEDRIAYDVPAVVRLVKRVTKARSVLWVGHGLGAVTMLGHLQRSASDDVAGLVAMATPLSVPKPLSLFLETVSAKPWLWRSCYARFVSQVGPPVAQASPHDATRMLAGHQTIDPPVLSKLFRKACHPMPQPVLEQVLRMIRNGHLVSRDGRWDYKQGLTRVRVPVAVLVGLADNLATVEDASDTIARLGTDDKVLQVFCRANGHQVDYAELDLVLSRHAPADVYPFVLGWLNTHMPPSTAPATQTSDVPAPAPALPMTRPVNP